MPVYTIELLPGLIIKVLGLGFDYRKDVNCSYYVQFCISIRKFCLIFHFFNVKLMCNTLMKVLQNFTVKKIEVL